MEIEIRKVGTEDYKNVMDINTNVYDRFDYLSAIYHDVTEHPSYRGYAAVINEKFVAFILAMKIDGGKTLLLRAARVKKEYEGKGLFRQFHNEVIELASQGIEHYVITVTVKNNAMIRKANSDDSEFAISMERNVPNKETMSSIISSVCLTDELADVYFRFPNDNTTRIPAHKTILSLRSPVFKAMFYGTFPRKDKDVVIEDVTAPIFESFMRYLYTDQIIFDKDNIIDLMYIADKYQVKSLLSECNLSLTENMNTTNACTIYRHASFFAMKELTQKSLDFIEKNADEVFKNDDFLFLTSENLSDILKKKYLNIAEVDVFKAVLRWTDSELLRSERLISSSSRRETLIKGNILYLIAFPALQLEDFTQIVLPTGILSDKEQLQVFKALTVRGPNNPSTEFKSCPRIRRKVINLPISQILPPRNPIFNASCTQTWTPNLSQIIDIQASKNTFLLSVSVFPKFQSHVIKQNMELHILWKIHSDQGSSMDKYVSLPIKGKPERIYVNQTLKANCAIRFECSFSMKQQNDFTAQHGRTYDRWGNNVVVIEEVPLNTLKNQPKTFGRSNSWGADYMFTMNLSEETLLGFNITGGHIIHSLQFGCEKNEQLKANPYV